MTERFKRGLLALALCCVAWPSRAAGPLRFWNTTAETIRELYVAPAGTTKWSANLCLSDPDRGVDPDERMALPGVAPGRYDLRAVDAKHRDCTFHDVELSGAGHYAYALSETQMAACK